MLKLFQYLILKNKKCLNLDLAIKIFYYSYSIIFLKNKRYSEQTKILISSHGFTTYKTKSNFLKNFNKYKYLITSRSIKKSIDSHYLHTYKNSNVITFLFTRIVTQYKISLSHIYKDYIFNKIYKKISYFDFLTKLNKYKMFKNFYFVSFERLHLYPEKSMKNICAALGINFSSKSLCDTISGHPVYFEGQQGKISGFSKNQAQNQELNFMSYFEKKTVEIIFKDEIKSLKYNSSYKNRFYNFIYLISLFKLKANIQKGNLAKLIIKFIFFDIFKEFKMLLNSIFILFLRMPIKASRIKFLN